MTPGEELPGDGRVFDHAFFRREPFTEREAWLWLVHEAASAAKEVWVGRAKFEVRRGELVHALRFLAKRWQWGESRVRRFLSKLVSDAQIDELPTREATRIRLCHYDEICLERRTNRRTNDAPTDAEKEALVDSHSQTSTVHARAHTRQPADAGAATGLAVSPEAMAFADELARIAGVDGDERRYLRWLNDAPGQRVQLMLNSGWDVDAMRRAATLAMRVKRDGPPSTIRYFEKIFARAHSAQAPLPFPPRSVPEPSHENARSSPSDPADWRARRDARHAAKAELHRAVVAGAERAAGDGDEGGGPALRLVSDAGRG